MVARNEEGFVRRIRIRDLAEGSSRAVYPGCDARFKDNTDDIQFLAALRKRLEDTGSLEKALTRVELMKVMRAKRIPLPQGATADFLRDKLKEVDERLYEANMECTRVANARRPKRARQASSVDDGNVVVRGDVPFNWHSSTTYNGLKERETRSETRPGSVYR